MNWPANNRFNAGFDFGHARFLGNFSVNYTDPGLLAGRARSAIRRHDRRLHAGQRRRSACSGWARQVVTQPQGEQPRQPGSAAAHLRRHPAPADRRARRGSGSRGDADVRYRDWIFIIFERDAGQLVVPQRLEDVVLAVDSLRPAGRRPARRRRTATLGSTRLTRSTMDALDAKNAGVVAHADDASVEGHEPGVGIGTESGVGGGEGERVQVNGVHS